MIAIPKLRWLADLSAIPELLIKIIDNVSDGAMFKSLLWTCKMFYEYFYFGESGTYYIVHGTYASEKYWRLVDRFSNHIETRIHVLRILIQGDSSEVSEGFVSRHHELAWEWGKLSKRKDLSLGFIENFRHKLHFNSISRHNRNLTVDFLREHIDYPWSWYYFKHNKAFTIQMMRDAPDLPWELTYWSYEAIADAKGMPVVTDYPKHLEDELIRIVKKSDNLNHYKYLLSKLGIDGYPPTDEIYDLNKEEVTANPSLLTIHRDVVSYSTWCYVTKHLPLDYIFSHPLPWVPLVLIARDDFNCTTMSSLGATSSDMSWYSPIRTFDYIYGKHSLKAKCIETNHRASWIVHCIIRGDYVRMYVPRAMQMCHVQK